MSEDAEMQVVMLQSMAPDLTAADAAKYLEMSGGDVDVAFALYTSEAPSPKAPAAPAPVPAKKAPAPAAAKKPQEYYAGGSQNSGTAIIGGPGEQPPAGGGRGDLIGSILDQAREGGQQQPIGSEPAPTPYGGAGRRLGHTEDPSLVVNTGVKGEKTIRIAFYQNGFVVEDGPLRPMDDPENKAFLETLKKGLVPKEIAQQHPNTDISVAVADHHDEDYVQQFRAFGGAGNSLQAPRSAAAQAAATAAPLEDNVSVDDSLPSATMALQLLDNTRMEVRVNPGVHTINHLRSIAARATPNTPAFELWARDMPPRPLRDTAATIEAAKCVRCVVFMKRL